MRTRLATPTYNLMSHLRIIIGQLYYHWCIVVLSMVTVLTPDYRCLVKVGIWRRGRCVGKWCGREVSWGKATVCATEQPEMHTLSSSCTTSLDTPTTGTGLSRYIGLTWSCDIPGGSCDLCIVCRMVSLLLGASNTNSRCSPLPVWRISGCGFLLLWHNYVIKRENPFSLSGDPTAKDHFHLLMMNNKKCYINKECVYWTGHEYTWELICLSSIVDQSWQTMIQHMLCIYTPVYKL